SVAVAPALLVNQACNSVEFPEPSHSTVLFCAAFTNVGAVVSSIVEVAVVVTTLPQASLPVKITSTLPVAPHAATKLAASSLFVQVTVEQLSVASAPTWFANQLFNACVVFVPHCTIKLCACFVNTGNVVSTTLTVA